MTSVRGVGRLLGTTVIVLKECGGITAGGADVACLCMLPRNDPDVGGASELGGGDWGHWLVSVGRSVWAGV